MGPFLIYMPRPQLDDSETNKKQAETGDFQSSNSGAPHSAHAQPPHEAVRYVGTHLQYHVIIKLPVQRCEGAVALLDELFSTKVFVPVDKRPPHHNTVMRCNLSQDCRTN